MVRRELLLLDSGVRRSPDQVLALLHPQFVEFGASGSRWDAAAVTTRLLGAEPTPIVADGFSAAELAADVVLLTYEARSGGTVSLRSSVWVRLAGEWRLRFHQGTVAGTPPPG